MPYRQLTKEDHIELYARKQAEKTQPDIARRVGGNRYTPEEREFAETIFNTFDFTDQKTDSISEILPLEVYPGKGATDVSDVS